MEFIKSFMNFNSEINFESKYNQKLILGSLSLLSISFLTSLFLFQAASTLLFLLFLFESKDEKKKVFMLPIVKVFLIYVLVRLLTIAFSEHINDSIIALQKESLFYFASVPLIYYTLSLKTEYFKKYLLVFIASGVLVGIIGLVRFNINLTHRAASIVSGYSTYSLYLLTILPLLFLFVKKKYPVKKVLFWILSCSIFISGIITSLGRMNLLLMILILIPLIFIFRVKWYEILMTIALTVIICLISFNNNTKELNNRINQPTTLSDRDIIYKGFLEIYDEHPVLGYGPKTFKTIFPFYEQFADQGIGGWHSDYIQVYIESGLLGFAIYFMLIIAIFLNVFFMKTKNKYVFLAVFTALFISALTDGFITSSIFSLVFTSVLGISLSRKNLELL